MDLVVIGLAALAGLLIVVSAIHRNRETAKEELLYAIVLFLAAQTLALYAIAF